MTRGASKSTAERIRLRARGLCEYCLLPDTLAAVPFQVDHILARHHGGSGADDNLAWSCYNCNSAKGPNLASLDPKAGRITPPFHPRNDRWHDHFRVRDGVIIPSTAKGRTTVFLLKMNSLSSCSLRRALEQTNRI